MLTLYQLLSASRIVSYRIIKETTVIAVTKDCHKTGEHMARGDSLDSNASRQPVGVYAYMDVDSLASPFQL